MSLNKHYRVVMILGAVAIVLGIGGTIYGDSGGPLIVVIAAAAMALATWGKHGWDNRPRP